MLFAKNNLITNYAMKIDSYTSMPLKTFLPNDFEHLILRIPIKKDGDIDRQVFLSVDKTNWLLPVFYLKAC